MRSNKNNEDSSRSNESRESSKQQKDDSTNNVGDATMIVDGHVYKEKEGGREVIPFFVDRAAGRVRFAPVGRGSEEQLRTTEFVGAFEHVGPESSRAEEQKDVEEQRKENRELEEKRAGKTT